MKAATNRAQCRYWLAIGAFALPVLYVAIRFADDWLYDHFESWG